MNDIEHSIGRCVSILYRFGHSFLNKKLEQFGIAGGQHVILLTIFRNSGIKQEDLSCYLKIDKGSIAKSIKKLEDEGYIERHVDLDDKRAYKLYLTRKGSEIIPVVQEIAGNWEDMIVSDLSDSEKQTIQQLLNKMAIKAYNLKTNL